MGDEIIIKELKEDFVKVKIIRRPKIVILERKIPKPTSWPESWFFGCFKD